MLNRTQNDVPVMELMEPRLFLSSTLNFVSGQPLSYTDEFNNTVIVTLTGGGDGQIVFDGEDQSGWARSILVNNTSNKSKLTITVNGTNIPTPFADWWLGKPLTLITSLVVTGPLKSLKAPLVALLLNGPADGSIVSTLTMETVAGTSIVLGGLFASTMTLTGASSKTVSVNVTFMESSHIIADTLSLSLRVSNLRHSSVQVHTFIKITVATYFHWSSITALGMNGKGVSIGSINVKGHLEYIITAPGAIGRITAGSLAGTVTADSLGRLIVGNDVDGIITLNGLNVGKKNTLGSARIGRLCADMIIKGNAGSITTGEFFGSLAIEGKAKIRVLNPNASVTPPNSALPGFVSFYQGALKLGNAKTVRYTVPTELNILYPW